jgi:UDP-N-acetyl-D-glucosamine dehydrogenase
MLLSKIESREAVVGVLGLGYVGLPLASAFVEAGFRVLGFDTDPEKIEQLARGETYLHHLGSVMTERMRASGRFEPTADLARLGEADAILISVPTPLGPHQEPDLSFVERSSVAIAKTLRRGELIVLESTTSPGTTRDLVRPILERGGLVAGTDFLLAYSPEREDPGR